MRARSQKTLKTSARQQITGKTGIFDLDQLLKVTWRCRAQDKFDRHTPDISKWSGLLLNAPVKFKEVNKKTLQVKKLKIGIRQKITSL